MEEEGRKIDDDEREEESSGRRRGGGGGGGGREREAEETRITAQVTTTSKGMRWSELVNHWRLYFYICTDQEKSPCAPGPLQKQAYIVGRQFTSAHQVWCV